MNRLLKNNLPHILTSLLMLVFVMAMLGSSNTVFAQTPPTPQPPSDGAGFWSTIGNGIGNFILYIGSYIFGFFGLLLDASISKFIIRINELIGGGTSLGRAIDNVWVLVRDICNLAFIFGFIYVGIMTIIDAGRADTKRFLASIIIGALLINFSLFIAKAIIDVSNFISFEIYRNLVDTENNGSIALNFTDILGVRSIYTMPNANEFVSMTFGGNVAYYFMSTLMLIVAGFVLGAGAFLLMIRFVVLVLILCFSPILFAATVFPGTASLAKDLWRKLLSYAFFAPAYLLLLIVSINVLTGVMGTMRRVPISNALANQGTQNTVPPVDSFDVILLYGIGIFFLILSLQIAQKFGVAGADKAMGMVGTAKAWGQKKLTNTALFAPRVAGQKIVGSASKRLLKNFDKWQAKDKSKQSTAGKVFRGALAATNIDRSVRGTLESGKKVKFGLEHSYQDDKDYADERKKRLARELGQQNFNANFTEENLALLKKKPEELTEAEKEARVKLERAVAEASTKYLEELEQEQRVAIVELMTQSQIDALEKSEGLTVAEKGELGKVRSDLFKEKYGNNAVGGSEEEIKEIRTKRDGIAKANIDQLSAMGVDFLKDEKHAVRLTNSQMDDLKKKLTPTEYSRIDEARKVALTKLAKDNATIDGKTAQNHILKMKATDMSKLPKEVLIALAPQLPVSTLVEIRKQNTLNVEDQQEILKKMKEDITDIPVPDGVDPGEFLTQLADRQNAVNKWLDDSPLGKEFGK